MKLLIIIDIQNDFIDGALKNKTYACRKCCSHPQFFTLIRIWHGAKIAEKQVSKIERAIIPQRRKSIDGIIESESALLFNDFFKRNRFIFHRNFLNTPAKI